MPTNLVGQFQNRRLRSNNSSNTIYGLFLDMTVCAINRCHDTLGKNNK